MPNKHPLTWVVVANNCQANIYRLVKFPKIEEIAHLEHPESRLHDQDLISSKPGRTFQSGGTTRHAYQPQTTPKQVEALKFANQLVDYLTQAGKNGEVGRLYLLAEPSFLGLIRQHIPSEIQKMIVAEIAKDFTNCEIEAIEHQLSEV